MKMRTYEKSEKNCLSPVVFLFTKKDSVQFSYDWMQRVTSITSTLSLYRRAPVKFIAEFKYHEDGQLASIVETPIYGDGYKTQEFRFEYHGLHLNKLAHYEEGTLLGEATVEYSAPSTTYSFEALNKWFNYVFDKNFNLVAKRIGGKETVTCHPTEDPGIMPYVKTKYVFQIVAERLHGTQLFFNILNNNGIDHLEYNYQQISIDTKKDEFGRIAQAEFKQEMEFGEMMPIQTIDIYYTTF